MLSSLSFFFFPVRSFLSSLSFFLSFFNSLLFLTPSCPVHFLSSIFVFCIPSFCHLFYLSLFILFYESMTVDVFDFFFSSPSVHQYMKPVLIPGVAHSLKYSIIQKYNTQENKGGGLEEILRNILLHAWWYWNVTTILVLGTGFLKSVWDS